MLMFLTVSKGGSGKQRAVCGFLYVTNLILTGLAIALSSRIEEWFYCPSSEIAFAVAAFEVKLKITASKMAHGFLLINAFAELNSRYMKRKICFQIHSPS